MINYRKIPVLLPKKYISHIFNAQVAVPLRAFLTLVLLTLSIALIPLLVFLNHKYSLAKKNHDQKLNEYYYWNSVVLQYPNIPDVLYDSALSAYNAGKTEEAMGYIEKALQIDPLFEKAVILKDEIKSLM